MKQISINDEIKAVKNNLKKSYLSDKKEASAFLRNPEVSKIQINLRECNLSCRYCHARVFHKCANQDFFANLKERLKKASGKLKFSQKINISSSDFGEPLLYQQDFVEFSQFLEKMLKKHSINYSFCTNGTVPLSKKFTDFFSLRNTSFQVSYDFFPELHDSFRQTSFGEPTSRKVLEFIDNLRMFDFPVSFRMTLSEFSIQTILKSFDSILSQFNSDKIAVNLVHSPFSCNLDLKEESLLSPQGKEAYLLFYLLNRLIFRHSGLFFVLLFFGNKICTYLRFLSLTEDSDFASGCSGLASLIPESCYGRFIDNEFSYSPSRIDTNFLLNCFPEICRTCNYLDFCGAKSCVLIKKTNQCYHKFFRDKILLKDVEEKYQTFPFFELRPNQIKLYHPFETLVFNKNSSSEKSSFIYETDFKELFNFILGYTSQDFKILLFYNKEPIETAHLLNLSKALKNKNLFIVFVKHIPIDLSLSYKLIIPKTSKQNFDLIMYDSILKKLTCLGETLFNFDLSKTLIDRRSIRL